MLKRIVALGFIFACTSLAWFILSATIFSRSGESDKALRGEVASTWGTPLEQRPPTAFFNLRTTKVVETTLPDGKRVSQTEPVTTPVKLPVEGTDAKVVLTLEHRQKGLLWYSTYKVFFQSSYLFHNTDRSARDVVFRLKFPSDKAIYDDFAMAVNGKPLQVSNEGGSVSGTVSVPTGAEAALNVSYRSQGLDSWRYNFGDDVSQVRNFKLAMLTNFRAVDFPENTLSPTAKQATADGWELTWNYNNLLSGFQIAMAMPQKLQPGPLAGQISMFAPVSLFFSFS